MTKQELIALGLSEENAEKVLKEHIPYERFKQVNDEKKTLEGQLNGKLQEVAGLTEKLKGFDETQKTIDSLNAEIEKGKTALLNERKTNAITAELAKAKAKNAGIAIKLLNLDKIVANEDGTFKGIAEEIEALKKSEAYLFEAEQQKKPFTGFNPQTQTQGGERPTSLLDAVRQSISKQA